MKELSDLITTLQIFSEWCFNRLQKHRDGCYQRVSVSEDSSQAEHQDRLWVGTEKYPHQAEPLSPLTDADFIVVWPH